jgi:hypothetical protein
MLKMFFVSCHHKHTSPARPLKGKKGENGPIAGEGRDIGGEVSEQPYY